MDIILVITKSTEIAATLIKCKSIEDAIERMKTEYDKLCRRTNFDYYNTYIDEDEGYAQVALDLGLTEFRIGIAV